MTCLYKMFGCVVLATACGTAAHAGTIFNFDLDSPGTSTIFTDTVGGLSATFSSSADPGGFLVGASFYSTLTGNVLADPGFDFAGNLNLTVGFSADLVSVSLLFATSDFGDPSQFTLTAFEGAHQVGTSSAFGAFPPGFDFPEGSLSFQGATFNTIVLSTPAQFFAVDNVDATAAVTTAAPEPATIPLVGLGLIGVGLISKRRHTER